MGKDKKDKKDKSWKERVQDNRIGGLRRQGLRPPKDQEEYEKWAKEAHGY